MKLAFVACLSLLSSATSLRSLASHSAFMFAAAAPTPVQNTCSHGSADGEKSWGGGLRSVGAGGRRARRGRRAGRWFSQETRLSGEDARVGPRAAPSARVCPRETNPKPREARARMTRGHPEALTSQEGELAQRVDVQLHAEPQRGADECGAHVVLAVRRRYGTLPAARACW